jgi:hypothetical protein
MFAAMLSRFSLFFVLPAIALKQENVWGVV